MLQVRNDTTGELLGCVPMYLKGHSYGEYVFDNSWASYANRLGMPYYPKLQVGGIVGPVHCGNNSLVWAALLAVEQHLSVSLSHAAMWGRARAWSCV